MIEWLSKQFGRLFSCTQIARRRSPDGGTECYA